MSELEETLAWQVKATGLPEPVRELRFAPGRRFRADFAWPHAMLLVEVDGGTWVAGRHNRGAGIEADAEKQSIAAVLGWRVIRVTAIQVDDGRALRWIEMALGVKPVEW